MSGSASQPVELQSPVDVPPLDVTTRTFTPVWREFFQSIVDRLNVLVDPLNSGTVAPSNTGVIMQTGTGTSDIAAGVTVTLPVPYTTRTLDFQCDGGTIEPHAYFNSGTVVSLPLDTITGTLNKIDPSSGSVIAVANTPFTWFAAGV